MSYDPSNSPQRDSTRVTLRCKIKYGTSKRLDNFAICTDVSESGVCIKTNYVFDEGTVLNIRLETNGKKFDGAGIVMWSKQVPKGLDRVVKNGMGIRFTKIDEKFLELCREKAGEEEVKPDKELSQQGVFDKDA